MTIKKYTCGNNGAIAIIHKHRNAEGGFIIENGQVTHYVSSVSKNMMRGMGWMGLAMGKGAGLAEFLHQAADTVSDLEIHGKAYTALAINDRPSEEISRLARMLGGDSFAQAVECEMGLRPTPPGFTETLLRRRRATPPTQR